MVDIGKLNRRITFLRLETSEDEMGQDKSEWKKYRTVWATGVQYPIIDLQTQCLCGFAGFSIQEIMMSKDIFPDSLSYMICSTTLLIRFPFAS